MNSSSPWTGNRSQAWTHSWTRTRLSARVGTAHFDPASQATRFALTLIEGKKRQIRRAMRSLGHPVVHLLRVRMGPLRLGALAAGAARALNARERRALRRSSEDSGRRGPGPSSRARK